MMQSLARHSTPVLTLGTYAHVGLYDESAAMDSLLDLTTPTERPEAPALAATGTDPSDTTLSFRAAHAQQIAGGRGRVGSDLCEIGDMSGSNYPILNMIREPLQFKGIFASVRD